MQSQGSAYTIHITLKILFISNCLHVCHFPYSIIIGLLSLYYSFSFSFFWDNPSTTSPFLVDSYFFSLHHHWNAVEGECHEKISTWNTIPWHTVFTQCLFWGIVQKVWSMSQCWEGSYFQIINVISKGVIQTSNLWEQVPHYLLITVVTVLRFISRSGHLSSGHHRTWKLQVIYTQVFHCF